MQEITQKIIELLSERRLSQQKLAVHMHKSQSSLNRRLNNGAKLTLPEIKEIAAFFKIPWEDFVRGTDKEAYLQTPQVIENALKETQATLAEVQVKAENLNIENESLRGENERLAAELRERPQKEELAELRELSVKAENNNTELQERLRAVEAALEEERQYRQKTERSWDALVLREMQLGADKINLRNEVKELERVNARLLIDKERLSRRFTRLYEELESSRKVLSEYRKAIKQAQSDGNTKGGIGTLLGGSLIALLLTKS